MAKFKIIYDNLVTDDEIVEFVEANSVLEAEGIAMKHSRQTGLSEGNYTIEIVHSWKNGNLSGTELIDVDKIAYEVDLFADANGWTQEEKTGEKWNRCFKVFSGVNWV